MSEAPGEGRPQGSDASQLPTLRPDVPDAHGLRLARRALADMREAMTMA